MLHAPTTFYMLYCITAKTQGVSLMFSRFRENEKGQALVETALVLPLLIILILGIIQFGIIFNNQVAVASAAREGARSAAVGAGNDEINAVVSNALSHSVLLQNVNTVITPHNRILGRPQGLIFASTRPRKRPGNSFIPTRLH